MNKYCLGPNQDDINIFLLISLILFVHNIVYVKENV